MKPGPDAAVPQNKAGDDSGAVPQGDQGEQGFVSIGLRGYARSDAEAAEPLVRGRPDQALTGEYEGFLEGSWPPAGSRRILLDEEQRRAGHRAGEERGRDPGGQGSNSEVGLAFVEEREGNRDITGPHGDPHPGMSGADRCEQVRQKTLARGHRGEHPDVPAELVSSDVAVTVLGPQFQSIRRVAAEAVTMLGQRDTVWTSLQQPVPGRGFQPLNRPGQRGGADVSVGRGAGEVECLGEVEEEPVVVVVLHLSLSGTPWCGCCCCRTSSPDPTKEGMSRSDDTRPRPTWSFPESMPVGVDLGSRAAVAGYDRNQGTDPDADDALLDRLGVTEGTCLVDLACGTGSLVVQAARRGAEVHGVDVSEEMLAFAQARADRLGVAPHWHRAGFLEYAHLGRPADVVTTKSALHQLPDFWKQQALLNVAGMLSPGGTFYLWDVIFSFEPADAEVQLQRWIDTAGRPDGQGFTRADFETHVREEFSTYAWILEGMLDRAGFDIVSHSFPTPTHGEFHCRLR